MEKSQQQKKIDQFKQFQYQKLMKSMHQKQETTPGQEETGPYGIKTQNQNQVNNLKNFAKSTSQSSQNSFNAMKKSQLQAQQGNKIHHKKQNSQQFQQQQQSDLPGMCSPNIANVAAYQSQQQVNNFTTSTTQSSQQVMKSIPLQQNNNNKQDFSQFQTIDNKQNLQNIQKQKKIKAVQDLFDHILNELQVTKNLKRNEFHDGIEMCSQIDENQEQLWLQMGAICAEFMDLYALAISEQHQEFQIVQDESNKAIVQLMKERDSLSVHTQELQKQFQELQSMQNSKTQNITKDNYLEHMKQTEKDFEIEVLKEELSQIRKQLHTQNVKERQLLSLIEELTGYEQSEESQVSQDQGNMDSDLDDLGDQNLEKHSERLISSFQKIQEQIQKSPNHNIKVQMPNMNLYSQFKKTKQDDLQREEKRKENPEDSYMCQTATSITHTKMINHDLKLISNKLQGSDMNNQKLLKYQQLLESQEIHTSQFKQQYQQGYMKSPMDHMKEINLIKQLRESIKKQKQQIQKK